MTKEQSDLSIINLIYFPFIHFNILITLFFCQFMKIFSEKRIYVLLLKIKPVSSVTNIYRVKYLFELALFKIYF